MMKKNKYIFGETKEIINEKVLSKYYDAKVNIKNVGKDTYIVFENEGESNGINVVC